ncbi:hypothetical protein BDP27DRAFT_1401223 [Rhodocollybia butyracea]|uniref:Uncharacterized protein n=1 Tax=Rhodocollybia butyracea TaxID=206335 RepID=A0A9P5UB96_9AGAR|nr:hypothetical protein BDP27DRAFT_1401223 [Rhodocollybia butyracea]
MLMTAPKEILSPSSTPVTRRSRIVTGTGTSESQSDQLGALDSVKFSESHGRQSHYGGNFSQCNPPSNRKRNRENETPSQRIKREKAAERQRRKRERDRLGIPVNYIHPPPQRNQNTVMSPPPPPPAPVPAPVTSISAPASSSTPELTPEEEARRDRVRAAARDRQRKHRALVKQKKLRELGMDMGNDISGPSDDTGGLQYSVDPQAGYHATMISPPPPGLGDDPNDSSFSTPNIAAQGPGGQMFATTLLLSFSCAPLLKQHLLNSLQMSNEELASLEPIIADAWDQWDRQRRQQHQQPFDGSQQYPAQHGFVQPPSGSTSADITANAANEFRARFHRSLVVPTPFQTQAAAAAVAHVQANAGGHNTVSGSMNGMSEEEGSSAGVKADNS